MVRITAHITLIVALVASVVSLAALAEGAVAAPPSEEPGIEAPPDSPPESRPAVSPSRPEVVKEGVVSDDHPRPAPWTWARSSVSGARHDPTGVAPAIASAGRRHLRADA